MACRAPLGFQDYLDLRVHEVLGVLLGHLGTQVYLDLLEPKDRKGTRDSHQDRLTMGQRATWACLGSPEIQDPWDGRDTRATLERQGTLENRGSQDLRAVQGPKVTLAGRGSLDL